MGCTTSKTHQVAIPCSSASTPSSLPARRPSLSELGLTDGLEERLGKRPSINGRFHRTPHKVEDDYEILRDVLGQGLSGEVHLARRKDASLGEQMYAVKSCAPVQFSDVEMEQLRNEVLNMLSMDHPHIVRLYDVYETEHCFYLVMECLDGGELLDHAMGHRRSHKDDRHIAGLVRQMLLALNYIHSHGVVHRDLKLQNVVFERKDSNHLKLIDFGLSAKAEADETMDLWCGTRRYIAPEMWDKHYTSQCDLWSLGVISYALISGEMPFAGPRSQLADKVRSGRISFDHKRWSRVSPEALDFVRSLLDVNPDKRLTAKRALEHSWIVQSRPDATRSCIDKSVVDALLQFSISSKFQRCCMEMMAWLLSNEDLALFREHFISMDKNGQGTVTLEEFSQALQFSHISDKEVQRVFAALDSNHDLEVNYSDFLAAMVANKDDINGKYVASTFKKFDTNGSGYIEVDNLRELLGDSFEGFSMEQLIQEADKLHDNRISYDEFTDFCKMRHAEMAHTETGCMPFAPSVFPLIACCVPPEPPNAIFSRLVQFKGWRAK